MDTDPSSVTGDGGNTTIRNQNEQDILDRFVASIPMVGEDDPQTYVNPQFRDGA
jgi:hypothetical protein